MSATNYYFSTNTPAGADRPYTAANSSASGSLNQGTSSVATDFVELRIMTIESDGATKTGITKRDVENFLVLVRRWLHDQAGTASDDAGQGLDYLIGATGGTVGVP